MLIQKKLLEKPIDGKIFKCRSLLELLEGQNIVWKIEKNHSFNLDFTISLDVYIPDVEFCLDFCGINKTSDPDPEILIESLLRSMRVSYYSFDNSTNGFFIRWKRDEWGNLEWDYIPELLSSRCKVIFTRSWDEEESKITALIRKKVYSMYSYEWKQPCPFCLELLKKATLNPKDTVCRKILGVCL